MKIGEVSRPRFEFRTFGADFSNQASRMEEKSAPVPRHMRVRYSEEVYIVSKTNNSSNTKIRNGKIDIKVFVQNKYGLEQWNPLIKSEFPISRIVLEADVFPAIKVSMPELKKDNFTLEEFLEIVERQSELLAVSVNKERFGYIVNDTICETANVEIDGTKVATISIESTEIQDIHQTMKDVGLEGFENINYLEAIKRTIGWIDKSLGN